MTQFNPEKKDKLTFGEALTPAMEIITDASDAKQYKAAYVEFIKKNMQPFETKTPEEIANANLRYYAGYYDNETVKRVNALFIG